MHPDYYWLLLGACAICLLCAAGVRHALCPPLAAMMSVVVGVFMLAYAAVASGSYGSAPVPAPVASPSPTPTAQPKAPQKKPRKKKRTAAKKTPAPVTAPISR